MDNEKIEDVYSRKIRAGKRSYFFDVKLSRKNLYYLTITESIRQMNTNEYKKHRVVVYPEDFNKFLEATQEVIDRIKTKYMPDYDYKKFDESFENFEGGEEDSDE